MKYYVVSDVHGFFSVLKETLKEKGFFNDTQPHKLIICGDLFDRGGEAVELQNFILDLIQKDEVILIKGNHEDLLEDMLNYWHRESYFKAINNNNGTVGTVLQLTRSTVDDLYVNVIDVYHRMKETPFMQKILPAMVNYYETKKYIFVHGWIPCEYIRQKDCAFSYVATENWRNATKEQWLSARWVNGMNAAHDGVIENGKIIVCGHWRCSYGHSRFEMKCTELGKDADFTPYYGSGIIAIDACTARSKTINCVVLED